MVASGAPERALLARVRERLRLLRPLRGDPPSAGFCGRVRRLVVVCSSSRGGSTIFAELLRRSPRLLHFRAEVNPLLALAGLAFPESGTGCDALGAAHAAGAAAELDEPLAFDCGNPERSLADESAAWRFTVDLACRLTIQWPEQEFDPSRVHACAEDALARAQAELGWSRRELRDEQTFHALFLGRLREHHPEINPHHYDIEPALIERFCPGVTPPEGPPSPVVIEEPPYVTIGPWRRATDEDLASRPLVVKTPSNAYRLPFLAALFSRADLRVLHLTRNVAGAVNGLCDGWRSRGFFAHRVPAELRIAGYSDLFPAWGRSWWKFDLPPDWPAVIERPLEQVCALQWRAAHAAVVAWLDAHRGSDALQLRFEDVFGTADRCEGLFRRLSEWMDLPLDEPRQAALGGGGPLRPVMATTRPRHRRWFARAALLQPALEDPANLSMMDRLGYERDPTTWL